MVVLERLPCGQRDGNCTTSRDGEHVKVIFFKERHFLKLTAVLLVSVAYE